MLEGIGKGPSWRFLGHGGVLRLLERALAQGRLGHAYLLAGPGHVGKGTLALDLALAVNCQGPAPPCGVCASCGRIAAGRHADVVVLRVDEVGGRKAISIEAVRELQHQAHLKPYEGASRVFIIEGAELLTEAAANALLKTLEEPPPQVLLILTTTDPETVLPTIRSRCQEMQIRPLPGDVIAGALETRWEVAGDEARRLARLAHGCIGWAIQAVEDPTILETRARRMERLSDLFTTSLGERFSYAAELAALMPQQRSVLRETLDLWASLWRDALMAEAQAPDLATDQEGMLPAQGGQRIGRARIVETIRAIQRTEELLELNVNPRLALEGLMLALPVAAQGVDGSRGGS